LSKKYYYANEIKEIVVIGRRKILAEYWFANQTGKEHLAGTAVNGMIY
jgi:hypothetical protein